MGVNIMSSSIRAIHVWALLSLMASGPNRFPLFDYRPSSRGRFAKYFMTDSSDPFMI
jgi:hypothetical protein